MRFASPVYPGDTVRFEGEVASVEDGQARVEIEGTTQEGDVVLEGAVAEVRV